MEFQWIILIAVAVPVAGWLLPSPKRICPRRIMETVRAKQEGEK